MTARRTNESNVILKTLHNFKLNRVIITAKGHLRYYLIRIISYRNLIANKITTNSITTQKCVEFVFHNIIHNNVLCKKCNLIAKRSRRFVINRLCTAEFAMKIKF